MFQKIVTDALLSPSAISELGPLADRLKKIEKRRRIGIIVVCIAIVIQLFSLATTPSSSNSANSADLLYGGFHSKQKLLQHYDANEQHLQDIYTDLGITRTNLAATTEGTYNSKSDDLITTRGVPFGSQSGSRIVDISTTSYQTTPARNFDTNRLSLRQGTSYRALVGSTQSNQPFAALYDSGNVVIKSANSSCIANPSLSSTDQDCAPCASDASLWIKDENCTAPIQYTLKAHNQTTNKSGPSLAAHESDRLTYTVSAHNIGNTPAEANLSIQVQDALEYGTITDAHGGTLDERTHTLSWPTLTVSPGETTTKTYTLRLAPEFASTPQGASNPLSYDCVITQSQMNTTTVQLSCPAAKQIELLAQELPTINKPINFIFSGVILFVTLFLYLRVRTLQYELRLLRKELNTGSLL